MPVEARFFPTTGPGPHPTSYTMGTGSVPGVKRPRHAVDHPPSSAKVKERVELYLYSPLWAFVACSRVNFILYFYLYLGKFTTAKNRRF